MSDDWPMVDGPVAAPQNTVAYVTGFNHAGQIMVQTWHASVGSWQIEVEVWKDRMRKGEVSRIEIMHVAEQPARTEVIRPQDIDMPAPPQRRGKR